MRKNNDRLLTGEGLFAFACFGALLVFFVYAHPIVMFDTDDWLYVYYHRLPFPTLSEWNPTRMFPELLMPMTGKLSAITIMPLTKNYVSALSWGFAVVVSLFAGIYCLSFLRFLRKRFGIVGWPSLCLGILFFLSHFLVFRTQRENNIYLFHSISATCYFYYTIPALLNASLVMLLLTDDVTERFFDGKETGKKAAFVLLAYLAIFSNLYESVILAVFCAVRMLLSMYRTVKEKGNRSAWIRENMIRAAVVIAWFLSLGLESAGARAASLQTTRLLPDQIGKTIRTFGNIILQINPVFAACVAVTVLSALILSLRDKRKSEQKRRSSEGLFAIEALLNGILVLTFLILLCARTGYDRIARADILLSLSMYFFVPVFIAACSLLKRTEKSALILPLLILLFIFSINTTGTTFRESNLYSLKPETCFAVTDDIVEQLKAADALGQREIVLDVPQKSDSSDNWPFAMYAAPRFSGALYEHGVISQPMEVQLNPSEEFNREYSLPW